LILTEIASFNTVSYMTTKIQRLLAPVEKFQRIGLF